MKRFIDVRKQTLTLGVGGPRHAVVAQVALGWISEEMATQLAAMPTLVPTVPQTMVVEFFQLVPWTAEQTPLDVPCPFISEQGQAYGARANEELSGNLWKTLVSSDASTTLAALENLYQQIANLPIEQTQNKEQFGK